MRSNSSWKLLRKKIKRVLNFRTMETLITNAMKIIMIVTGITTMLNEMGNTYR